MYKLIRKLDKVEGQARQWLIAEDGSKGYETILSIMTPYDLNSEAMLQASLDGINEYIANK